MEGSVSHYTFTKEMLTAVAEQSDAELDTSIPLTVFCLADKLYVAAPQLCRFFKTTVPCTWTGVSTVAKLSAHASAHSAELGMGNRVKNFFNLANGSLFLSKRGLDARPLRHAMQAASIAMRQRQALRVVPKEKEEVSAQELVIAGAGRRKTRRVQPEEEAEVFYPSTSSSSSNSDQDEPEPRDESRRKASPPPVAVEQEPTDEEARIDVFLGEQLLPAFAELKESVRRQVQDVKDSLVPMMRELIQETVKSAGCTFTALNVIGYQNTDAWKRQLDQEVKDAAAPLIAKKIAEHDAALEKERAEHQAAMDKQLSEYQAKCNVEWRALEAQRAKDAARGRSEGFAKGHDEGYAEGKRVGYAKGVAEGEVAKLRQMGLLTESGAGQ